MSSFEILNQVLPLLREAITSNALLLVALLVVFLLVQTIRLTLASTAASRRVARHRKMGETGEKNAVRLLKRAGYQIVSRQTTGCYNFRLDGKTCKVTLHADFIVSRKNLRFLAEVKSGKESAKATGRATRRQLLEYLFAFEIDGLLLVDMHQKVIRNVEFPSRKS